MVLAKDQLFVAGPPHVIPNDDPADGLPTAAMRRASPDQHRAPISGSSAAGEKPRGFPQRIGEEQLRGREGCSSFRWPSLIRW